MIFDSALSSGSVYAGSKAFEYVKEFNEVSGADINNNLKAGTYSGNAEFSGNELGKISSRVLYCLEKILGGYKTIKLTNTGVFKNVQLWKNEEINNDMHECGIIEVLQHEIKKDNWSQWKENSYLIELCVKRKPFSNYAKLGVQYIKKDSSELDLKVYIGCDDGSIVDNTIATLGDEVHLGIPKEYGEEIIRVAKQYLNENVCSTGELIFNIGAHGYYGSSQSIFGLATLILLKLITCTYENSDDLELKLNSIICE